MNKLHNGIRFIKLYMIIFASVMILFTASGTFYRAISEDVNNMIFNGICCLINIGVLSVLLIDYIETEDK